MVTAGEKERSVQTKAKVSLGSSSLKGYTMKKIWLLVLVTCLTLSFSLAQGSGGEPKNRVQVTAETRIPASPEEVWKLVGNFNGVPKWYPAIAESTLEDGGKVRRVRTADGAEGAERLLTYDDAGMSYSYRTLKESGTGDRLHGDALRKSC